MEKTEEPKSGPRRTFDAYLGLPSESYEFITRSLVMHHWLREAFDILRREPELDIEKVLLAWRPSFDQVYNHLFTIFLRPYRLMSSPVAEYLRQPFEMVTPKTLVDSYVDIFKMWGEAQSRSLKGTAAALEKLGGDDGGTNARPDTDVTGQLNELTPFNVLRNVADEQTRSFFETLDQWAQYLGERQFLLPKEFFVRLQEVASSYPKARRLGRKYEEAFHHVWEAALKKFAEEVKKSPGRELEFGEFFKGYVTIFGDEYKKLLGSPEFIQLQNEFTAVNAGTILSLRKLMEAQLDVLPFLPFANRSEADALAARLHSYKRRIDSLERKMREMEGQLKRALSQAGGAPAPAKQPVTKRSSAPRSVGARRMAKKLRKEP